MSGDSSIPFVDTLRKTHRSYCRRIDKELDEGRSQDLQDYIDEARQSIKEILPDSYNPLRKQDFIDGLVEGLDILYVGDFHPDPRNKELLLEISRQARKNGRKVVWVLEAVPAVTENDGEGEVALREYYQGGDQAKLFGRLRVEEYVGADRVSYVNLFETARDENIRIVPAGFPREEAVYTEVRRRGKAGNGVSKQRDIPSEEIDRDVAKVVSHTKRTDPDALICVFYGDHHLSRNHLPTLVETEILEWSKEAPRSAIVFSSNEFVYNNLVEQGREHDSNIVSLGDSGAYVVINTTPLERRLSRLLNGDYQKDETLEEEIDLETVEEMRKIIAKMLGIRKLDDLGSIYLGVESRNLFTKNRVSENEHDARERRLLRSRHTILPDGSMYVEHVRIRDLAELLGVGLHYSYLRVKGLDVDPNMSEDDFFWYNVLRHTMGYVASKTINHTRRYRSMGDYKDVLEEMGQDVRTRLEGMRDFFKQGVHKRESVERDKQGKVIDVGEVVEEGKQIYVKTGKHGRPVYFVSKIPLDGVGENPEKPRQLTQNELWGKVKEVEKDLALANKELALKRQRSALHRHDSKVGRQAEIATSFDETGTLPVVPSFDPDSYVIGIFRAKIKDKTIKELKGSVQIPRELKTEPERRTFLEKAFTDEIARAISIPQDIDQRGFVEEQLDMDVRQRVQIPPKYRSEKSKEEFVDGVVARSREQREANLEKERGAWQHKANQANNERDDLAEILGYQLGHKIFAKMVAGDIPVQEVRDGLFQTNHSEQGQAEKNYKSLLEAVKNYGNERYNDFL